MLPNTRDQRNTDESPQHARGLLNHPNAHLPRVLDWAAVARDVRIPVIVTNSIALAHQLCGQGQPAIAVLGVTQREIAHWLRKQGANVREKGSAH